MTATSRSSQGRGGATQSHTTQSSEDIVHSLPRQLQVQSPSHGMGVVPQATVSDSAPSQLPANPVHSQWAAQLFSLTSQFPSTQVNVQVPHRSVSEQPTSHSSASGSHEAGDSQVEHGAWQLTESRTHGSSTSSRM
jgi:hypothetical protein